MLLVTYIIIGITVVLSFVAWSNPNIMQKWIFNPYTISKRNEWHRFLTSGFIHLDYLHLIFNMVSLYFLGIYAEKEFYRQFGENYQWIFVIFYLSAIIVADIPVFWKNRNNAYYNALGASGAVSAIVFSAVMIEPNIRLLIFPIPFPVPGILYAVLYVAYSAYMSKNARDNIGHDAHLYGSLYGVVFTLIFFPDSISKIIEAVKDIFS
ncbi:MAG: rhomboid family intramembrane serine protease [Raineya sp.]|nr:rhomboid family intramembrane serine protease [Raineya sp.]MDW8295705.1 rhomboid family intramembrane serine protease [Raineya sp.]